MRFSFGRAIICCARAAPLLLYAVLGLFAVSCNNDVGEGHALVTGTISDSLTKLPIAEAWLAVTDSSEEFRFYADSSGNFRWVSFGHVNVTLFVGREGYLSKSRFFSSVGGEMPNVNFELAPSGSQ